MLPAAVAAEIMELRTVVVAEIVVLPAQIVAPVRARARAVVERHWPALGGGRLGRRHRDQPLVAAVRAALARGLLGAASVAFRGDLPAEVVEDVGGRDGGEARGAGRRLEVPRQLEAPRRRAVAALGGRAEELAEGGLQVTGRALPEVRERADGCSVREATARHAPQRPRQQCGADHEDGYPPLQAPGPARDRPRLRRGGSLARGQLVVLVAAARQPVRRDALVRRDLRRLGPALALRTARFLLRGPAQSAALSAAGHASGGLPWQRGPAARQQRKVPRHGAAAAPRLDGPHGTKP
mmetsp:Transcript_96056/g.271734  ORF Transcript_96056/g.271734 Transcript_96056/m.271734 type:complete len:296 (-) Transcript_96056:7-894(-)